MDAVLKGRVVYAATAGFEAARQIVRLPSGHAARRLHGHGFLANVLAEPPDGWVVFPGAALSQIQHRLKVAVAPLDYAFLNDRLPNPTDVNLASWMASRLDIPHVAQVGIRSTRTRGVALHSTGHVRHWRRYALDAAHWLPNVPIGHRCARMHGHGFEVVVAVDVAHPHPAPLVIGDCIDARWMPIHADLHQVCLNDVPGLDNPTSELLASYLWRRLKAELPELTEVTVYETASCGASFDGQRYRIWKEMTLDSACRLERAPPGDPRRCVHGHTYTLRLHLGAPLDALRGWVVDFADVKAAFAPIYQQLDHRPLHELVGVVDTDTGSLVRWIAQRAAPALPQLQRLDLFERPGCGAIFTLNDTACIAAP